MESAEQFSDYIVTQHLNEIFMFKPSYDSYPIYIRLVGQTGSDTLLFSGLPEKNTEKPVVKYYYINIDDWSSISKLDSSKQAYYQAFFEKEGVFPVSHSFTEIISPSETDERTVRNLSCKRDFLAAVSCKIKRFVMITCLSIIFSFFLLAIFDIFFNINYLIFIIIMLSIWAFLHLPCLVIYLLNSKVKKLGKKITLLSNEIVFSKPLFLLIKPKE